MCDTEGIKKRMRMKGTDARRVSKRIGMSESLFSCKLNNQSSFNIDQAQAIKEVLGLSDKVFLKLFFAD